MKISTRGRYGLRAMIDLALHENEGRVTLAGIAVRQDLSLNYLESIFPRSSALGLSSGRLVRKGDIHWHVRRIRFRCSPSWRLWRAICPFLRRPT